MPSPLRIVILGLSITSSWGNGHATIFRALVKALSRRGHDVLFLERDMPWYAQHRDLPHLPAGRLALYDDIEELKALYPHEVREADLVIVGSYVPDGIAVGEWVTRHARGVTAFYDIDTPVTFARLQRGDCAYLSPLLVGRYDLYLSFTGGPILRDIEHQWGAPRAVAFHCCVDPELYFPADEQKVDLDLGYLGTYSDDRQPALERLLLMPARQWPRGRFAVTGPQYPEQIAWPANVARTEHLPPGEHRSFYNRQRWTLNITRADMIRAGHSPSVRLFEAAACGTPIISDRWAGLGDVLREGTEIIIADSPADVLAALRDMPQQHRSAIANAARARVLREHTAEHRARQLEELLAVALPPAADHCSTQGLNSINIITQDAAS